MIHKIYSPIFFKVAPLPLEFPDANEGNPKYIDGLEQDCSNSIADALELLQSWTKPLIWAKSVHTKEQNVCIIHGKYSVRLDIWVL